MQSAAFREISSLGEALQATSARRSVFGAASIDIQRSLPAWLGSAGYEAALGTLSATKALDAIRRDSAAYRTTLGNLSATKALGTIWRDSAAYKATHLASVNGFRVDIEDLFGDKHANALIENGWYVLLDAPEPSLRAIAELFRTDPDAANERMCELVRSQVDSIENDVVEQFPRRAEILRDAFAAHRQGTFSLSIPVFIAQTDGCWYERCGRNLFGDNIDETIENAMVGRTRGGITEQLLRSLTNSQWQLRQSKKERAADFCELNRHQVLHGEVTDYDTEKNSLKAITLLHFSSVMLPRSGE